MLKSSVRVASLAALCLWILPDLAQAAEVRLTAPDAGDGFADRLRSASLTITTAAQQEATAQDLLAAAQSDYGRLIGVLYAEGFYGGVIRILVDGQEAASIPPLRAPSDIRQIDITVERNAPFVFSTARVAPLAPKTKLPPEFVTGNRAKGDLIGDATRSSIAAWRTTGHAKALVSEQTIIADHAASTLSADIQLDPGPRLHFGELLLAEESRESRVRPDRIRDIAGLPTGRKFSPEELDNAATRLRRSGAFRSVVMIEADRPNPDGSLDITARVTDAPPRRLGFGAELASLEGLTLSGFWLHRNLFGGAERLRLDAMIGGIGGDSGGEDYRLGARYDRPATFHPDTGLFLEARIEGNDEPDYTESKVEVGGGFTRVFSDELRGEAGIAYRYSDIDDDLGRRELQHLLFPARLTWDKRDDALNATSGLFLEVSLTPFIGLDQRSGDGARIFADARHYRSFGAGDRYTLAGRAQIGSVAGPSIGEIPADMLFYSGGAGTVRGQDYQSLGVDIAPGVRVGGRAFVGFSGEFRASVTDKIQGVAFVDTGFVGQDALGTGRGDWHSGAGIGARYFTPVGPIRVDIATPLGERAGEDLELYIGIGQAF
ncbi:translocation and assembly module TamA [Roseovarius mucosus]|uniref:Translocation and assembly module TamA n=1 Tax=Roseovarius mucosus TaxID=215743 RepID=A0A1V0RUL0_9RHOB|nr:BamA/TamA family outer membrane protein [Roseovarius mucosus]ARE85454.1 translocation and assembly module TamA [Roseovarius mucosus]